MNGLWFKILIIIIILIVVVVLVVIFVFLMFLWCPNMVLGFQSFI